MNLLWIQPLLQIGNLLGLHERRKIPGKVPHHVEQFFFLQAATRMQKQPAGEHLGGETVGAFLHHIRGVRPFVGGLNQHEQLVADNPALHRCGSRLAIVGHDSQTGQ